MITTKEVQLSPKKYLEISLWHTFHNSKWFIVVWVLIMVVLGVLNHDYITFPAAVIIFLGIIPFFIWLAAKNQKNRGFYKKHSYRFDDNFFYSSSVDGTKSELAWTRILEVRKRKQEYLLYISAHQFIYIPFHAFTSEKDRKEFEKILENKNLLPEA